MGNKKKKTAKKNNAAVKNTNQKTQTAAKAQSGSKSQKMKKEKRIAARAKGFTKGLIIGILIGAILMVSYLSFVKSNFNKKFDSFKDFLENIFTGNRNVELEIKDIILGEASEHDEFIVMEQNLTIATEYSKQGLINLDVFKKTKNITYSGTGVFTVDFGGLNAEHIAVDKEKETVSIRIPHSVLQYVMLDKENIIFEDTERGFLAFGDIKMTLEEQNALENQINDSMKEKLAEKAVTDKADEYALKRCEELFAPLIKSVAEDYKVIIEFE